MQTVLLTQHRPSFFGEPSYALLYTSSANLYVVSLLVWVLMSARRPSQYCCDLGCDSMTITMTCSTAPPNGNRPG